MFVCNNNDNNSYTNSNDDYDDSKYEKNKKQAMFNLYLWKKHINPEKYCGKLWLNICFALFSVCYKQPLHQWKYSDSSHI